MPDQTIQGSPDLARVTSLIKLADRLGLTWGLRPGTVFSVSMPYSSREASVQMDGDLTGINVVSLIGDLAMGDRVMVIRVPPAGEYAIGLLNRPAPFTTASTVNTGVITVETVVLTIPAVTLRQGTAYRVEGGSRINAGAAVAATYRLRRTNIAGAIVATSPDFAGIGLGLAASAHWTSFITPVSTLTDNFVCTLQATGMGATDLGSPASPRFISITPVGNAANFPQAVPVP